MLPNDTITQPLDEVLRTCGELELRPLRVANVLRELQASTVPERGISIALEVDESLHVAAHELLLSSVVRDVLHHAMQASCSGKRIVMRCRAEEPGVAIDVEDECGALPLAAAEPFLPLSPVSDERAGRSLSTVKLAVEAMAGDVSVENHGEGCSLVLHFPLLRSKRPSSVPAPASRA